MSDRWDDISALFEAALDQPRSERSVWLEDTCGDTAIRREVQRMLAAHERAEGILDRPLHAPSTADGGIPSGASVGPYRVLDEIGRGGMGVVYKARDPRLDRFVALKVLPASFVADEQASLRFEDEARAIAALDHPNICTIYDVGTVDTGADLLPGQVGRGRLFLAMAYYDGPTFAERIEAGPDPVPESLSLATQVAQGLGQAHETGIVHRDVKPSNLILTDRGTVKILDFGIAKLERDAGETQPEDPVGTVAYMAPEQVRGETVTPQSDLWALGVVLYELLTGEHPFGDGSEAALLHAILNDEPPSLQSARPDCPEGLDEVLRTAIAKRPDDRYASAAEMIDALETLQTADAISTGRASEAASAPGPLPAPLTSFVGREREVSTVQETVARERLVTLTGPAGTGKTRLAVQVAHNVKAEMNDGVFFVPLAPVTDPDRVPSAIAQALDVDEKPSQPVTETLKAALREKETLLVLDNFEQVITAAPSVAEILTACPGLRILVTSRKALRLSGEREVPVPPLEVPPADDAENPEHLRQYSAVSLFIERAAAVRPSFGLTERNAVPVAELCRRLEGLPLAIELAAARIKLFSAREMLDRLGHRLDLLKGGPRDRPARHQTLRHAIAWSYDLLDDSEQAFFRRMAVFVNGCTLQAAETVTNAYESVVLDVVDGVSRLVDGNLLRREEGANGSSRYVMLEMIRAYGLEQLENEGEAPATRAAHADYFVSLAEDAEPNLTGANQGEWLERLEAEHDNFRAALSWAEETGHTEMGLRLGGALWRFWAVRDRLREGCRQLNRLLDRPDSQPSAEARARALNAAGTLLHEVSNFEEARSRLQESLEIWRDVEDRHGMTTALNNLGWIDVQTSNFDRARTLSKEALSLSRTLQSDRDRALSLNNLGWVAMLQGEFENARSLFEDSLSLRRKLEDERGTAFALTNLAWADQFRGEYDQAEDLLRDGLSILKKLGDKQLIAWNYNIQALVAHDQGTLTYGGSLATECVTLWREVGNKEGLAFALCTLANIRRRQGAFDSVRACVDEAVPIIRDICDRWDLAFALWVRGALAQEEGRTTDAIEKIKRSLTIWSDLDAKWGVVKCLEVIAAARAAHDSQRAVRLVAAAETLRDRIRSPRPPVDQDDHERLLAELRERIGNEAFQAAWERGSAMSLRDALAHAKDKTE